MFSLAKASAAVLAFASFARATITIDPPNLKGNVTDFISWTSTDPNNDAEIFTIELINAKFNSQFALANNVPTSLGNKSFEMPAVIPGDGYSVQFVKPDNITNIIASTSVFSIQENDVSLSSTVSGAATSASRPASATAPLSTAVPTLTQNGPSSALAGTGSAASLSSLGATPASASSAATVPSSSSAAMELIPSGSFAALIVGAIALLF